MEETAGPVSQRVINSYNRLVSYPGPLGDGNEGAMEMKVQGVQEPLGDPREYSSRGCCIRSGVRSSVERNVSPCNRK